MLATTGLVGLSLRGVAREAGISPNALYTYFENLDDLKTQLADAIYGRVDYSTLDDGEPREALRRLAHQTIDTYQSSRGHIELLTSQREVGPNLLALNEAMLRFFIDRLGQSPLEAHISWQLLAEWAAGRLLQAPYFPSADSLCGPEAVVDVPQFPRTLELFKRGPVNVTDTIVDAIVNMSH